jgi:N-ethylmaleimide reductase
VAAAIGGERVGIRLSPYGVNAGMTAYPEIDETFKALVGQLAGTGILYVHLVDHSSMGAPEVPMALKRALRAAWPRAFILAGGFDRTGAEAALSEGRCDLVSFGRAFIANPDLVSRMQLGHAFNELDFSTFYTPGAKGYTDYPAIR